MVWAQNDDVLCFVFLCMEGKNTSLDTKNVKKAVERFEIKENDTIVLLGDIGMNYFGNKHGDRHRKKRLNKLGVTMFCIYGNHEMRPETIHTYHEMEWHGGIVYVEEEYPNLLFAKDGEVYDGISLREMDRGIYSVCTLCRNHEKAGFGRKSVFG